MGCGGGGRDEGWRRPVTLPGLTAPSRATLQDFPAPGNRIAGENYEYRGEKAGTGLTDWRCYCSATPRRCSKRTTKGGVVTA